MKTKKLIKRAINRAQEEIRFNQGSHYARGLSGEGYSGGYVDALMDVLLLLNGCLPDRRNYWREERDEPVNPEKGSDV